MTDCQGAAGARRILLTSGALLLMGGWRQHYRRFSSRAWGHPHLVAQRAPHFPVRLRSRPHGVAAGLSRSARRVALRCVTTGRCMALGLRVRWPPAVLALGRALRQPAGGGVRSVGLRQPVGALGAGHAEGRPVSSRRTCHGPDARTADAARLSHRRRRDDGADLRARPPAADGAGTSARRLRSILVGPICGAMLVLFTFSSAGRSSTPAPPAPAPRWWRAVRSWSSCRWCRWPTCRRRRSGSGRWRWPSAEQRRPPSFAAGSCRRRDPDPAESRAAGGVPLADGDGAAAAWSPRPRVSTGAVRRRQYPWCAGCGVDEQPALRISADSGYGDLGPAFSVANAVAEHPALLRRGGSRARDRSRSSAWSRCGSGAGAVHAARVPGPDGVRRQRWGSCTSSTCRSTPGGTCASCCRRYRSCSCCAPTPWRGSRVGRIRRAARRPCSCLRRDFGHTLRLHPASRHARHRQRRASATPSRPFISLRRIPPDAVILAMQHSGSLRYYTGRLILRWDALDPAWLDRAVAFLRDRGIATYAGDANLGGRADSAALRWSADAGRTRSGPDRDGAGRRRPHLFR